MKKLFVLRNNDAKSLIMQKMILDSNDDNNELIITGTDETVDFNNIESDILTKIGEFRKNGDEVYSVEFKKMPKDIGIRILKNSNKSGKEINSIERLAEILDGKIGVLELMVAANEVGSIPKMIDEAHKLGITNNEIERLINRVDELESISKLPKAMGFSREIITNINNVNDIYKIQKKHNIDIANKSIDDAFVYDKRFVIIDLPDVAAQREVLNKLYKMGNYNDMYFSNILIKADDLDGVKSISFFR